MVREQGSWIAGWRRLLLATAIACGAAVSSMQAEETVGKRDPAVFHGPPAALTPLLEEGVPPAEGPLRLLTVVERVGEERRQELVRVPVFFHPGECLQPEDLKITAVDAPQTPLVWQADDIRRDPNGQVSRMHLYLQVDLKPWQRKQFHLSRRAKGEPAAASTPLPLREEKNRVTLGDEAFNVTFWTDARRGGAIADIDSELGAIELPHQILAPRLTLRRQDGELNETRASHVSYLQRDAMEIRDLRYDTGPLFAKLVVRIGPKGLPDNAEYTYRIPRHGQCLIQTQRLFPDDPQTTDVVGAVDNHLLGGRLVLGESAADIEIVQTPAGLRERNRREHRFSNAALLNRKARLALFPIPYVQTGVSGIAGGGNEGYFTFAGTENFHRTASANSSSLRSFWGEVRFQFLAAENERDLWHAGRRGFQPLTAVVDEPGTSIDGLLADFAEIQETFGYTHARDWKQEVGRLHTMRKADEFQKRWARHGRRGEDTIDYYLTGAEAARTKLLASRENQRIKEYEKGRASGPLDPWSLTYGASSVVPLSAWIESSDYIQRLCRAAAAAQRQFNGRVDEFGFPYIDCFHTALNMQVGSYLMGIYAGKSADDPDPKLVQWCRDGLRTSAVLGIYGHGQRTYPSLAVEPGNSDFLYESTSDFWLRYIELVGNEDLWIHPMVFGRYFDCIDVNADLIQRSLSEKPNRAAGWDRANFFRGQSHDHRWEAWAAAPYLGLLERASDGGKIGLTEARYYTQYEKTHHINWPEITTFALTDLALTHGLRQYSPATAPALPTALEIERSSAGNRLSWEAVPKAAGYRIYRAPQEGGPWTLVNSPYMEPAQPLVKKTAFVDTEGKSSDQYFVTAVTDDLRESRWFPEEPAPVAGK